MKTICEIEGREDVLLDFQVKLRQEECGHKYGAPDELLLQSGGPQSDLAQRSLLMGPAIRRYLVRQQPADSPPKMGSPLRGEINIQAGPAPLQIHIEDWNDGWTCSEIIRGIDLADGLRQLSDTLLPSSGEGFQAGGLAGLLTYDMVQHTEPLRLQNVPLDKSVLMVLYRTDRWIIHDRIESTIEVHSSFSQDHWVTEIENLLKQ